jgi:hypothetical protein
MLDRKSGKPSDRGRRRKRIVLVGRGREEFNGGGWSRINLFTT